MRVVPKTGIVVGEVLNVTSIVNVFSSVVTVDSLSIIVGDVNLFEDKIMVSFIHYISNILSINA